MLVCVYECALNWMCQLKLTIVFNRETTMWWWHWWWCWWCWHGSREREGLRCATLGDTLHHIPGASPSLTSRLRGKGGGEITARHSSSSKTADVMCFKEKGYLWFFQRSFSDGVKIAKGLHGARHDELENNYYHLDVILDVHVNPTSSSYGDMVW